MANNNLTQESSLCFDKAQHERVADVPPGGLHFFIAPFVLSTVEGWAELGGTHYMVPPCDHSTSRRQKQLALQYDPTVRNSRI